MMETQSLAHLMGMIAGLRLALEAVAHTLTEEQRQAFSKAMLNSARDIDEREDGKTEFATGLRQMLDQLARGSQ